MVQGGKRKDAKKDEMAPGVYSASSRNEYLKIFLEVKSG
jgi:hypothetical protein